MGAAAIGIRRLRNWEPGPLVFDLVVALVLTVLAIIDAVADEVLAGEREPDAFAFGLVIAAGVSLVWRRRGPLVVLVVVGVAMITFWLRDHGAFLALLGLPSLYAVAVYEDDRRRAWTGIVIACVSMMVAASFTVLNPPAGYLFPNAITMAAYLAGAATVGVVVRNRARIFRDTQRRVERAETERRLAEQRAVMAERSRIAREMHDVVAHGMSVVAIQASAAQEVVHERPDKAFDALGQIEEVSRASLSELRRMLGALRATDGDRPGSLQPQPGIADVGTIVDETRAAGFHVELAVSGSARPLAPGLELAAYRIVQESLTNVRKHAGPGSNVDVTIEFLARTLKVEVADDGTSAPTASVAPGCGNGLVGIRERTDIYGGTCFAGPSREGGWVVTAALPISAADEQRTQAADAAVPGGAP